MAEVEYSGNIKGWKKCVIFEGGEILLMVQKHSKCCYSETFE